LKKNLLRKAFDNKLLPDAVLWRKKEAFSDGVSKKEKSWYSIIQDYITTQ
jgi:asparagine synthase (glutamine-hydrolysing)